MDEPEEVEGKVVVGGAPEALLGRTGRGENRVARYYGSLGDDRESTGVDTGRTRSYSTKSTVPELPVVTGARRETRRDHQSGRGQIRSVPEVTTIHCGTGGRRRQRSEELNGSH